MYKSNIIIVIESFRNAIATIRSGGHRENMGFSWWGPCGTINILINIGYQITT